jgi:diguanylate cyclase (GGDEF)-like protein
MREYLKSIRAKTQFVLISCFVGLVFIIYLVVNAIMQNNIRIFEQHYVTEHVQRAENGINLSLDTLAQTASDWAIWDDTYQFVIDRNRKYIDNNFNVSVISNINLNAMLIMNLKGQSVYEYGVNLDKQEVMPVSKALVEYLRKSPVSNNTNPNYKMKGLVLLPEGPMLIASWPILPSNGVGPVRGNLVVGRYLDHTEIGLLAKTLGIHMTIDRMDELDSHKAKLYHSIQAKLPVLVRKIDQDHIGGYTILRDITGKPVVGVCVKTDREISKIGHQGMRYMLYALVVASFVFTTIMLFFLEKNILSRLLALNGQFREIGNSGIFSRRLKLDKIHDEIDDMTSEINAMLDKLETAEKKVIEGEALKRANEELENRVLERTLELSQTNESLQTEICERKKMQEQIEYLAYHDYLTDLPNRLLFNEQLTHAISLTKRIERIFAIMFLDLDGFKIINDTMGHDIGDQLLIGVAKRLAAVLRKSDIVARFGGDEFIILVENIEDSNHIEMIAQKILNCFNRPFVIDGQECFITTCIGIAIYPTDGENAEKLIKNADVAMFKAKENGKNQYAFCTVELKNKVLETMKLTNKLYRALERNEFLLYYQPQLSCSTNKIVGVEALIRWNHPEMGMVSPGAFIPIAEQAGLINAIGEWVLQTACRQNKIWQDAGLPKIRMGVNLSVRQLQSANIVRQVDNVLRQTGLLPGYLELEITESVAMREQDYVIEVLRSLMDRGLHIAIDDFGTEYSSLNYLKKLPIDKIKIARPFVRGIGVSEKDEAIISAIIVLAKSMGFSVLAEGVETEKQLMYITQRMCDEVQGFYYYKPLPAKEMEELLRKVVE